MIHFVSHNIVSMGAVALALIALAALIIKTASQVRRIGHFLDDWFGEAERPGVAARPGVTARLSKIEDEQARVRREFEHNGGGSLKDAVKRVESTQAEHAASLRTLTELLGGFASGEQQARLAGHEASQAAWNAVEKVAESEPRGRQD